MDSPPGLKASRALTDPADPDRPGSPDGSSQYVLSTGEAGAARLRLRLARELAELARDETAVVAQARKVQVWART